MSNLLHNQSIRSEPQQQTEAAFALQTGVPPLHKAEQPGHFDTIRERIDQNAEKMDVDNTVVRDNSSKFAGEYSTKTSEGGDGVDPVVGRITDNAPYAAGQESVMRDATSSSQWQTAQHGMLAPTPESKKADLGLAQRPTRDTQAMPQQQSVGSMMMSSSSAKAAASLPTTKMTSMSGAQRVKSMQDINASNVDQFLPRFKLSSGEYFPGIGFGTAKVLEGEQLDRALSCALDCGYRLIDCAWEYENEAAIGRVLNEYFNVRKTLDRSKIWISSKVWNTYRTAERVRKSCMESLKALQVDYLDMYLMHWPVQFEQRDGQENKYPNDNGKMRLVDIPLRETWEAMEQLVNDGLVKHIGVSNFTIRHLEELFSFCTIPPAVNQIELHPYLVQKELVEYCSSKGVHVSAYAPVGSPDKAKEDDPILLEDSQLRSIAEKYNVSPGAVCLRWNLQRGCSVLPKSTHEDRILSNLYEPLAFELTDEDMQILSSLPQHRYFNANNDWKVHVFDTDV